MISDCPGDFVGIRSLSVLGAVADKWIRPVPRVRAAREHYRTEYGDLNATVDSMM